jgi:hypothetical protein
MLDSATRSEIRKTKTAHIEINLLETSRWCAAKVHTRKPRLFSRQGVEELKVLCHITTGELLLTNDAYRSLVLPCAALC